MDTDERCPGCTGLLDRLHKLKACPRCGHPLKAVEEEASTPWYAWGPYPLLVSIASIPVAFIPMTIVIDSYFNPPDVLILPLVAAGSVLMITLYRFLISFRAS